MVIKNILAFSAALVIGYSMNLSAQYSVTLSIDQATSTIKREIYGALLENWGRDIYGGLYVGRNSPIPNTNGMRNDIIEGLKECGISTLEFPGGCFADEYHWEDGIGEYSKRPGGDVKNGMGTDEYMQLCSLINSEPYICANLNTGTPSEMEKWINYINKNSLHPNWHCKYWSMGNEPWGCGGELSATAFSAQYKKFAASIPTIAGKPVARIAGAGHWSPDWFNQIIKDNPGALEGFSVHRYLVNDWTDHAGPSFNYTDFQYHQIIQLAYGVTDFIKQFDDAMNKVDPEKKIGLMYNEWGAWYSEIPEQGYTFSQSTVRDALIAAIHLNAFNNNCERVQLACVAQPVNVIQSIFLTDKNDQTKMVKTPVFYAFKLFKVHQNAKKIPVTLQTASFNQNVNGTSFSYPFLTASASLDNTSRINITLSNSDLANAKSIQIQLNGSSTYTSAAGQIITADKVTALNDFGKAEQVTIQPFAESAYTLEGKKLTVNLPSKSVVLLTLTPAGTVSASSLYDRHNRGDCSVTTHNGSIVVHFLAGTRTPGKVVLCGLDGRCIAQTVVNFQPENSQFVWQPADVSPTNGIYIVHVSTDDFSLHQKVTISR